MTPEGGPRAVEVTRAAPALPPRVNVLGVGVSATTIGRTLDTIDRWIAEKDAHYVCVSGVHGVMECQRDADLRQIHNRAGLVTPDGMPLVWLSRLKGHGDVERVYGPDLMLACCERSVSRGYRHFLYGGQEGVPELLAERLTRRFPGLLITGCYSPPFGSLSPAEDEAIVRRINDTRPDIVWVGLSTPKQERWMSGHVGRVQAPVLIGVGAAFDFHAGLKRQAPGWMRRNGLEWLFRLLQEPRRLWRRYLINNPLFLAAVLRQVWNGERYAGMPDRDTRPPLEPTRP
ncbi:MAG TPA: WecB/TagA/CpsF family glycosyltransferase [Gemmatimonadales bacterium]|nr:WecB/TagA/CpsF family glycosyltransferase [Gemmatimonadales bacterium]